MSPPCFFMRSRRSLTSAPVCGGDRITFSERIADIREKKGGTLVFVVTRTVATNQRGGGEAASRVTSPPSATLEVGTVLPDLVVPPLQRQGNELTCGGTVAELFAEEGERRARLELIVVDQGGEVKVRGSAVVSLE